MKKFIITLACFSALLLLMCAVIEVGLLFRPNVYAYKRQYMENHLNDIRVLLLGSSHVEEAVKPELIGEGTFNLAISARLKEYDAALAEMYVPRMEKLEVLVMPVDYTNLPLHAYQVYGHSHRSDMVLVRDIELETQFYVTFLEQQYTGITGM